MFLRSVGWLYRTTCRHIPKTGLLSQRHLRPCDLTDWPTTLFPVQTRWSVGGALASYSGGPQLESQPRYRPSLLKFFFYFVGWGETGVHLVPAPDDRWVWSVWWNENWQGKPKYSEKIFPIATLSTTNPTWPDLGSKPGRHCRKPATNRLSYGTALRKFFMVFLGPFR
jgi:hypothetical protein